MDRLAGLLRARAWPFHCTPCKWHCHQRLQHGAAGGGGVGVPTYWPQANRAQAAMQIQILPFVSSSSSFPNSKVLSPLECKTRTPVLTESSAP